MSVLVVGAGPSGLMMAAELARHGVNCRIVDLAPTPARESRALGVQARTLEMFDSLGLVERFLQMGHRVQAAQVFDGKRRLLRLELSRLPSRYNFILVLPQRDTERILGEHAESLGVHVERGVEVKELTPHEDGVDVAFSTGERTRFDWVVGCDGAHSRVRHALNLPFVGATYPEGWMLADLTLEWELPRDEIQVFFGKAGFMGVFPMPNGQTRLISDAPPEAAGAPTLDEIREAFVARAEREATLRDPTWTARYKVHRRIVPHLRRGRCFLVGDAAHIHSPAGGQGMNTGLQDAANLAWKLALAIRGVGGDTLLDSYETERLPVERGVLRLADALTRTAAIKNPLLRGLRAAFAPVVADIPAVQSELRALISETAIRYAPGAAVGPHGGEWAGVRGLPPGAKHLLAGRAAADFALAEAWRPWVEVRTGNSELRLIRPDGYEAARGTEGVRDYLSALFGGA